MRNGYGRRAAKASFLRAPLCPAGHLPHKGGDWQLWRFAHPCIDGDWRRPVRYSISPLVGEMPGKAEGGAKKRCLRNCLARAAP
ncbi:MAG: hypothetical protein E5X34_17970 [Mesorhizobium sp.]|nr:MAG: hypothetical protein E5X34_17970 [Mesorhizobium sp.]